MSKQRNSQPALLILNQMAGPITWELAEDLGKQFGAVALLTGHPDTLAKGSTTNSADSAGVLLYAAAPYQRGSFPKRAWSWLRYLVQAFFWLWRRPRQIPVLLFSNPPMLCWLGWLMAVLRGQRYAVMVHDIYPDVLIRLAGFSEGGALVRVWRWLNRRAYQRAEIVLTLGEDMAATLGSQFKPRKTRAGAVEVVYPWVDTARIKPMTKADNWFARQHGQVDKLTVLYAGNMGLGHDLETMVEAARQLQDLPQVHFIFAGSGPKWSVVQEIIQEGAISNVTLLGWQPEEALPFMLATAEIALVSLEDELQGLAVPSKSIFALAAGSALLVVAPAANELAHWTRRFGCGAVVAPRTGELVKVIRQLAAQPDVLSAMRQRARRAAETEFARSGNTLRVATLLQTCLGLRSQTR